MNPDYEFITIISTIIVTGLVVIGFIRPGISRLHDRMNVLEHQMSSLGERMDGLEKGAS